MSDEIKALATNMVERKKSGADPYILFLGAGASISSGASSMMQIVDDVLKSQDSKQFDELQVKIRESASINFEFGELTKKEFNKIKRNLFYKIWRRLDHESRSAILKKHLGKDVTPSKGYSDLVHLIKLGYIKMILSTNLDNLLEVSLRNEDLYLPSDYTLITNGKDRSEVVVEQLKSSSGHFKLIKLHGTLESSGSYAFTPEEVFDFEKTIKPHLSQIINRSLIVIGHSMQDRDIDILFDGEGKEIHFVRPTPPEMESSIDNILKVRRKGSIIKGDDGEFDTFFRKLRLYVEKASKEMSTLSSIRSIEGFLRSIGYDPELDVLRSPFKNLPTLYVKPTEYKDIRSKLEREHVVFIISEPHLGKTYTALYILWEYYQKGYETLHIRHDRLVTLLTQHNDDMKKLLLSLFTSENELRIIHFDDPFGETMKRRTDDAFAKELDTFLDLARGYEHLRIIVTSRLNIYTDAMALAPNRTKVKKLEKYIQVHTSYDRDILLDILHRYIRLYKPLWAGDKKIIATLNDQLPDMLPAPHNIEFFVRTSESLDSLEDVLHHVEKSKEMIKALGTWMSSLPCEEQFFLTWLEICSTTSILFPDTSASKMDFESAYKETLMYLFKRNYIEGISTSPFSRAKDKFDIILLENRDTDAETSKFDFVHPSYHEAFWYAIQNELPLYRKWELIKEYIGELLKNIKNKVDIVQLRMIERCGSTNRDMNQLLLLSAESADIKEQLIALDHMLDHPEKFLQCPQFSLCVDSVISSDIILNSTLKDKFLCMIDNCFDKLPPDILKTLPSFTSDSEPEIRLKTEKILLKYFDKIPDSIKQSEAIQTWMTTKNLGKIVQPLTYNRLQSLKDTKTG
jgi:hypothetical protein